MTPQQRMALLQDMMGVAEVKMAHFIQELHHLKNQLIIIPQGPSQQMLLGTVQLMDRILEVKQIINIWSYAHSVAAEQYVMLLAYLN